MVNHKHNRRLLLSPFNSFIFNFLF